MRSLWLSLLLGLASCQPAFAGGHHGYSIWGEGDMHLPEVWYQHNDDAEPGEPFGWVMHHNQWTKTSQGEFITMDTPHGEITLRLLRTYNNDCEPEACPDQLEVWNAPTSILFQPGFLVTPERGVMRMDLYLYEGS